MNVFTNIWKHPRTTVTGVLISVTTIAGVLSQNGMTLGHAGNATVVTLVGAVASALLGLMARDPGALASPAPSPDSDAPSTSSATSKLGAWALIALLLPAPFVSGCSGQKVAQDIVNWTPALQSAVATVNSSAALMAPADAAVFAAATASFDALSNALTAQAKAYLANPSASTLAQLQAQIVTFEQQVNGALLQAVRIANPQSQQHALMVIQAVATIAVTLLALVQSASSKTAVTQMAANAPVKLNTVTPYLDREAAAVTVARHYDEPVTMAATQMAQAESGLAQAGF
jgi:hypothetical protein